MGKVLTPKQKKALLKQRLDAVLPKLPNPWLALFQHVYPEYQGYTELLSNVRLGRSLDEDVIERLEKLATNLENIKNPRP